MFFLYRCDHNIPPYPVKKNKKNINYEKLIEVYNEQQSLAKVGEVYGVSRQRVHQWLLAGGFKRVNKEYVK